MAVGRAVRNPGRTVRNNLPELAGGSVGIGAPIALRETVDVRGGEAVSLLGAQGSTLAAATRPSVAWGVGVGSLTGLLWWQDVGGRALQDFYLAHSITGIPTGVASALMPVQAGGGAEEQRFLSELRDRVTGSGASKSRMTRTESDGEFAAADGEIPAAK